jgi:integrase
MKEQRGLKHSTAVRYKDLTTRIYPAIGHIKLKELRADHLNSLYTELGKPGQNKRTGAGLSAKTIIEHHRLISTVLEQAVKEGLVPFNVAGRATLPKATQKEVNYFQQETVAAIRDALEEEPIKWRTLTHLFLITGARRGELLGLKWDKVDFEGNRIYICNSVLYSPDVGIYESTPKTERSKRFITLPGETMQLLRKYRAWQSSERLRLGAYYQNQNFVFTQDNGKPLHPDSVTDWLTKFSKRHNLPHINPHAFRHTMASMLYFNGVDSVSISKRLGHAQVSTTANIYAHVMEEADQRSADILSEIFLKKASS